MLSAEHYALENEVLRNILEMKQKEIEFYLDRFSAIATQSALLLGIVTGGFASFDTSRFENPKFLNQLHYAEKPFIYGGTLSLICSLHTMMVATFAGIWGPSLALRGPNGSVTKAYHKLKEQSKVVMVSFALSIFFFTFFFGAALFMVDLPGEIFIDAWVCAALVLVAMVMVAKKMYTMRASFKFKKVEVMQDVLLADNHDDATGLELRPPSPPTSATMSSTRDLLTERLLSRGGDTERLLSRGGDTGPTPTSPAVDPTIKRVHGAFQCEGYLEKRGKTNNSFLGYESWAKRYFLLLGNKLYGFKHKAACHEYMYHSDGPQRVSTKVIDLGGYEVLVDSQMVANQHSKRGQPRFGFSLAWMDDHDTTGRNRYFRTDSKEELDMWVRSLVIASLTAEDS
jgi:hypothetical protein